MDNTIFSVECKLHIGPKGEFSAFMKCMHYFDVMYHPLQPTHATLGLHYYFAKEALRLQ